MSEEQLERQFRVLFSDSFPEPDPDSDVLAASQPVPGRGVASDTATRTLTGDDQARHSRILDIWTTVGVVGEAIAVGALIALLYYDLPLPLRNVQFWFASAAYAGAAMVLLVVQWQLARRLTRVERLVQRRNRQLSQALALIQRYQQQPRPTDQTLRSRESDQ